MLSWCPVEFGWNCDASKAAVFYRDVGFLFDTVLEAGPKPGIDITGHVYSRCSDEVVPAITSMSALCYVPIVNGSYHEVRVKLQCQKNVTMNTTTAPKCVILKNS